MNMQTEKELKWLRSQQLSYGEPMGSAELSLKHIKDETDNMQCTVIEVDVESWVKNPAVRNGSDLYLIQGNKRIGTVRFAGGRGFRGGSSFYDFVSVEPNDEATKAFFKDDIGWIDGHLYGLKYSGITGEPYVVHDEDEGRHKDTRIVDKFYFDAGICHPSFASVEGFDSWHKKPKPRHRVPQKQRRRRDSNKIKKVR